jgi:Uma2 family endonuclease
MSTRLGDIRIVIRGVDPDLYNRLDAAIDEGQHILVAYDGSAMELMKVGILHEHVTGLLGSIVMAVTMGVGIRTFSSGRATRKTKGLDRGLQPDLSYSFDHEKVRMGSEAIARRSHDPADYPVPDLAIDVEDGSCEIDRRGIYAALGVAEVWRSDGKMVAIERLRPDGSYAPALESRFLPISAVDVRRWLVEENPLSRPEWDRRLIEWAMALGGRA